MSTVVGYHGDKEACPGSEKWALWLREEIRSTANSTNVDLQLLQDQCAIMEKHKGYLALKDSKGKNYRCLRDILVERPIHGIGLRMDIIDRLSQTVSKDEMATVTEINAIRNEQIREKYAKGDVTQQELGDEYGLSRQTITYIVGMPKNEGIPPKIGKPKRTRERVPLESGTNPIDAAQRIRDRLGHEFAQQLKEAL
jgi:hypothetical protein